jgi:myo-inositol-hexaphosphate 3-phosphohydrolase
MLGVAVLAAGLVGGLAAALGAAQAPGAPEASRAIQLSLVSRLDAAAAEISAYDPVSQRLFVTGAGLQIIDISDPSEPEIVTTLPVEATSVAIRDGIVAAAVPADPAQDPGKVLIMDTDGVIREEITVGALPDMLTFTPDGTRILVANEGEADATDPEGSVSIIRLGSPSTVQTAGFSAFNADREALKSAGVRIFPSATSVAQDVEPEYIACTADGATAMVTLQEANAVAVIDLASATVTGIVPLGLKDWSAGPMLDPSDKDGGIAMAAWPVYGMFMPDAIASFTSGGRDYFVTANEGDARDEVGRIKDLDLDPTAFPNAADLQQDAALGRLNASSIDGDLDGDGDYDRLQVYGGRSFSVWDANGSLVYDSGDVLESVVADLFPDLFNANDGLASEFDKRSDDKGPEAEGVTIGQAYGATYAFVGMERAAGGVMAFDMTDPAAPEFATFARSDADISPEGITFIKAEDSPNGVPLVVLTHEVGGTVTIYGVVEPGSEPDAVPGVPQVRPVLETRSVLNDVDAEDAPRGARLGDADDPSIWVHPRRNSQSIVISALKDGGIDVYDLDGQVLQEIAPDDVRYNNVDVAYGFRLAAAEKSMDKKNCVPKKAPTADIAVATDRYNDVLAVFRVDPVTRELVDVTDPYSPLIFTPAGQESDETTTAYGIALWQHRNCTYAFVNRRETGDLAQLKLVPKADGTVGWRTVRTFSVPVPEGGELEDAQTEGMVVDERSGWLYIGQESVGIWKVPAQACSRVKPRLIHSVESDYLEPDVEGLTIYYGRGMNGYLLASSQGDNTFAVFSRTGNNRYLGSFQIVPNGGVDGSQECDGAQVMSLPMGPRFPCGLLVVQDGYNDPQFMVHDDGEFENSNANFKFVRWDQVAKAANLMIDTRGYDPRR